MAEKKQSFDIAAVKKARIDQANQAAKEKKKELLKLAGKEEKRKMVRVSEPYHNLAKSIAAAKGKGLQKYLEALIQLDKDGKVDWTGYKGS
mgnify:CR=1 FL=1